MNILIDENKPRSLAPQITALGLSVQDVRDIGLRGHPDAEVMDAAIAVDAIMITRDRGLADPRGWSEAFSAGVIFINLPTVRLHPPSMHESSNSYQAVYQSLSWVPLQPLNRVVRSLIPSIADFNHALL